MTTSTTVLIATLLLLLITQVFGLLRAMIGPSLQDRMLSVQLLGTGGVALLLKLSRIVAGTQQNLSSTLPNAGVSELLRARIHAYFRLGVPTTTYS